MSDGKPHPDASVPTINGPGYQYEQEWSVYQIGQAKVTSSRVAITVSIKSGAPSLHELPPHFLVWDWKTGVKYVVSGTGICWHKIMTTFPRLQDIRRRSMHVQFVDEHRILGVSHGLDPDSPQLVTLLDTSHPAGNPQELREIEFGLDNTEGPISLMEGTYAQGAKLGSSFRTNRKNHVLCIAYKPTSQRYQYLVIDYESVCAVASKNEPSSHIPWDFWKHKTTQIAYYPEFSSPPMLVGPRAFSVSRDGGDGPMIWSFDFTPGACHFIGQLDPSSKVMPLHVIRWTSLTGEFAEGDLSR